eukprot:1195010-Prorocentrum_minimum.AAC.11
MGCQMYQFGITLVFVAGRCMTNMSGVGRVGFLLVRSGCHLRRRVGCAEAGMAAGCGKRT